MYEHVDVGKIGLPVPPRQAWSVGWAIVILIRGMGAVLGSQVGLGVVKHGGHVWLAALEGEREAGVLRGQTGAGRAPVQARAGWHSGHAVSTAEGGILGTVGAAPEPTRVLADGEIEVTGRG